MKDLQDAHGVIARLTAALQNLIEYVDDPGAAAISAVWEGQQWGRLPGTAGLITGAAGVAIDGYDAIELCAARVGDPAALLLADKAREVADWWNDPSDVSSREAVRAHAPDLADALDDLLGGGPSTPPITVADVSPAPDADTPDQSPGSGATLVVVRDLTSPDHDSYVVVDRSDGRNVFVGREAECGRYVRAIGHGHSRAWATTIGYWGGR